MALGTRRPSASRDHKGPVEASRRPVSRGRFDLSGTAPSTKRWCRSEGITPAGERPALILGASYMTKIMWDVPRGARGLIIKCAMAALLILAPLHFTRGCMEGG